MMHTSHASPPKRPETLWKKSGEERGSGVGSVVQARLCCHDSRQAHWEGGWGRSLAAAGPTLEHRELRKYHEGTRVLRPAALVFRILFFVFFRAEVSKLSVDQRQAERDRESLGAARR